MMDECWLVDGAGFIRIQRRNEERTNGMYVIRCMLEHAAVFGL